MNVLWMGLSIFSVILVSFFIIMGITKGVLFLLNGESKSLLHSNWGPLQVYSGDDSLGHPDLMRISELQDNEPVGEEADPRLEKWAGTGGFPT